MKIILITLLFSCSYFSYGQNWHQIVSGVTKQLNTIEFPSNQIGYIGGNDSLLLKTTDGGITWNALSYSGVDFIGTGDDNIINLKFISETIGYMTVGPYSLGVYKTIDSGSTWEIISPSEDYLCFNYGLFFFEEDNGFMGGSDCFTGEQIHSILEDGISPTIIHDLPIGSEMIVDVDFYGDDFGIAVSGNGNGRLFRTIDGGNNWYTIDTPITESNSFTAIEIINDTVAYACLKQPIDPEIIRDNIIETTDGGLTWHTYSTFISYYFPNKNTLHQSLNGSLFIGSKGGAKGQIIERTAFSTYTHSLVDHSINAINSYNDYVVWGVGDSGYIVVNTDPELLNIENKHKTEWSVLAYPNPTTDELTITYNNQFNYKVTTLLGQVIRTGSSTDTETISLEPLANGIYIVEVRAKEVVKRIQIVKQ